jgi:hypothetical protein
MEDKVDVKPTWRLAWGLFWRILLIYLGINVALGVILYFTVVSAFIIPWLAAFFAGG